MTTSERIEVADLEKSDQVVSIGRNYIPTMEKELRRAIFDVFKDPVPAQNDDISDYELLAEAVFWSLGELINNANKANNRWALLKNALFQRASKEAPNEPHDKLNGDIDYAIQHNQTDFLKKYNMASIDLTGSILKLIEMHKTNSFALSEKFDKKIDVTLRIRTKGGNPILTLNVINNSPMTVVDKNRVEYNLEKIKEDLINAGTNPLEAAAKLYDKPEDHAGGGFGAGLRSIVLFLKEGYAPFGAEKDDSSMSFSRLIQYRSAGDNTIFTIELPVPGR